MHEKVGELLPDGEARRKSICCENAYKKNSHDADNPWQPMKNFDGCFHCISLLIYPFSNANCTQIYCSKFTFNNDSL